VTHPTSLKDNKTKREATSLVLYKQKKLDKAIESSITFSSACGLQLRYDKNDDWYSRCPGVGM